ncbi:MAG: efflux RND transporter periplasmic adaptor subunit [Candidatus Marinimicrobia bacterium]|nr:efflux RND transporter periplasmic adaptor subunit [Candidatus Neomarinimicrobiota bacterium]
MKKWIIIGVVILVVGAIVVLNVLQKKEKAIQVQTTKVKLTTIESKVSASGTILPVIQVDISANVAGEITKMYIKEGEFVEEGQILAQLDKVRYEAELDRARSVYNSRKASLALTKKELKRSRALYKAKNISESQLDQVVANYEIGTNNLEQAKASLDQAKDNLNKTTIFAPISGTVIDLRKEQGEIAMGSTFQADIIMSVGDLTQMEVEVEVNENDVVEVSIGDSVDIEIDAIPDTSFKGIVTEIAHSATSSGVGTQESVTNYDVVVSMLEIPKVLRSGMSAAVEILTEKHKNVVGVPIQSITVRPENKVNIRMKKGSKVDNQKRKMNKDTADVKGNSGYKMYTKEKMLEVAFIIVGDTAKAVPVEIGIASEDLFEIKSGLSVGDEIVIGSHEALSRELQTGKLVEKDSKGGKNKDSKRKERR